MVYTPYFVKDKIKSELDIISEEIKMYDDEPDWIIDYEAKKSLFEKVLQEKIAGTCETIKEITPEILEKTYELFYQPSNMFLIASGNVQAKDIVDNKLVVSNENYEDILALVQSFDGSMHIEVPELSYGRVKVK